MSDNDDFESDSKVSIPWRLIGYAVLAIVLFVITAPVWQPLVVGLYTTITVVVLVIAVLGIIAISNESAGYNTIAMLIAGSALLLLIFSIPLEDRALVKDIHTIELTGLPVTKDIRYLPLKVANAVTAGTLKDPLYVAGDTHPFDFNGNMSYITPRLPSSFNNQLYGHANGAMVIYADGSQKTIEQEFTYGEGMIITDNVLWQLRWKHYLSYVDDIYYVIDENTSELLIMAPYVGYRYSFPAMVPFWKGVMIVHKDGEIEDLTPEAAMADSRFADQRLYPEWLARQIGEAWKYRNGIQNNMPLVGSHRGQADLADADSSGNAMPYYMPVYINGTEIFTWTMAFKPYGSSDGLYKLMYIDAHNGDIYEYDVPTELNLGGPERAISYVHNKFLQYDWENMAVAIEPLPTGVTGRGNIPYWKLSITNQQYNGLQTTVLVDSSINLNDNKQVQTFDTYDSLKLFLNGKQERNVVYNPTVSADATVDINAMSNDALVERAIDALEVLQSRQ